MQTARTYARIVLRLLLAALFIVAGVMKLSATEFEVHGFAHFGYASWFMYLIGVLELAGGLGLLMRRSAGWAALAMVVVMIGAVASHLNAGDGPAMFTPACVVLLLCALAAWIERDQLMGWNRPPAPLPQRG
jgi:putative oxidoreductase